MMLMTMIATQRALTKGWSATLLSCALNDLGLWAFSYSKMGSSFAYDLYQEW